MSISAYTDKGITLIHCAEAGAQPGQPTEGDVVLILAAIIAVVIVVVAFLVIRGRQSPQSTVEPRPVVANKAPSREIGKRLRPGRECCAEAQEMARMWFKEGPVQCLPLKDCPQAQTCHCQWERVLDPRVEHRRVGRDRRGAVRFDDKADRRSGQDRRKDLNDSWKGS
jgi:hypothetical protein